MAKAIEIPGSEKLVHMCFECRFNGCCFLQDGLNPVHLVEECSRFEKGVPDISIKHSLKVSVVGGER